MEKEEELSVEYIIGFNQGFIIQQHLSEIANKIPTELTESERSKGFQDGRNHYELLKNKQRHPYMDDYETAAKQKSIEPKTIDRSREPDF